MTESASAAKPVWAFLCLRYRRLLTAEYTVQLLPSALGLVAADLRTGECGAQLALVPGLP